MSKYPGQQEWASWTRKTVEMMGIPAKKAIAPIAPPDPFFKGSLRALSSVVKLQVVVTFGKFLPAPA